jgi:hypothetical protein
MLYRHRRIKLRGVDRESHLLFFGINCGKSLLPVGGTNRLSSNPYRMRGATLEKIRTGFISPALQSAIGRACRHVCRVPVGFAHTMSVAFPVTRGQSRAAMARKSMKRGRMPFFKSFRHGQHCYGQSNKTGDRKHKHTNDHQQVCVHLDSPPSGRRLVTPPDN